MAIRIPTTVFCNPPIDFCSDATPGSIKTYGSLVLLELRSSVELILLFPVVERIELTVISSVGMNGSTRETMDRGQRAQVDPAISERAVDVK